MRNKSEVCRGASRSPQNLEFESESFLSDLNRWRYALAERMQKLLGLPTYADRILQTVAETAERNRRAEISQSEQAA